MVNLALKILLQRPVRFVLSAAGVALAVMLILLLGGMRTGIYRQITAYIDNQPAEIVVSQEGVRNFLGARSSLSADVARRVEAMGGVEGVIPVIAQYAVVEVSGRKEFSLVLGYEQAEGGGPWMLEQGTSNLTDEDVVADAAVGKSRGLGVGDRIEILGAGFKVVGLSQDTSSWMTGMFFLTYDAASDVLSTKGRPSFLLVDIAAGQDADAVARRIESRVDGVSAVTREELDANDRRVYARILDGPILFMLSVAFLIGAAVVGLTVYTAIVERAKDYGALKAIGIRNGSLYGVVLLQSLATTVSGFVAGVALAYAVAEAIPRLNPRFMVVIDPSVFGWLLVTAVAMGMLGAFVPVRALARIDPAIAFRRGA